MDKRIKKVFLFVLGFISIVFFVWKTASIQEIRNLYYDDWAIYNYGQEIDDIKGRKDIDINVLPAWKVSEGVNEIVVAIVDTGVDVNSEVFTDSNILEGYDFYNDDMTIYDEYIYDYHGTYISATIAKVAPGVSIMPIKFMEATAGAVEDAILAIQYALKNGADIINCSWNFYEYNEMLYQIIRDNPSVLFVCAAGNYSANLDETKIYPCCYELDNIINVMAMDNKGRKYSSSGYGNNTVDIAAPGKNVKAYLPENDTVFIDGTSVATAFVSATAALMLSEDVDLTPSEVKEILITSAKKVSSLEMLCKAGGCIDVCEAIKNCQ